MLLSLTGKTAMRARLKHHGLTFGLYLLVAGCATAPDVGPVAIAPPGTRGLIVLESDDTMAYTEVGQKIRQKWGGETRVLRLNPYLDPDWTTLQKVQVAPERLVVAVGLPAARHARQLKGKKVVFCQVFNYADAGLIAPWMKGVSALPPASEQFRAWRAVNPNIQRVTFMTGPGLRPLVQEARAAANQLGIHLTHIQVNSDTGLRFAFERLGADQQGLWLVPDNRILSREVLREIMRLSERRGLQVLVFNPQLLSLGGLLSAESDATDIADRVVERLAAAAHAPDVPGPGLLPLSKANIQVSAQALSRLGLRFPSDFEAVLYAP
jgi:ABC-type uncharacterized transport system substrate-binding protein